MTKTEPPKMHKDVLRVQINDNEGMTIRNGSLEYDCTTDISLFFIHVEVPVCGKYYTQECHVLQER